MWRLPWFRCYPAKLLGALAGMGVAEGYVYTVVLLRIYEVGGPIPDNDRMLAHRTNLSRRRVTDAVASLLATGKLIRTPDGLTNPVAQQEIESVKSNKTSLSAQRRTAALKRWEKPQEFQRNDDASAMHEHCNSNAPEIQTDADIRKKIEDKKERTDSRAVRPSMRVKFEEFWKVYPRRDGSNPKAVAEKRFEAAVRSGADPDAVIAAATRYADEERAKDRISTRFIAQAATWLQQKRWGDYPAEPAAGISSQVFVAVDTPQWRAWQLVRRTPKNTRRTPEGITEGWWFESEWPPGHGTGEKSA